MPSNDLGATLIIVLCVILIGWFAAGTILNRSRAQSFLRMLRPALLEWGPRVNFRQRGSEGLEIRVLEPVEPFTEVILQVLLEPREVLLLWLFSRLILRRRDHFVVHAQLSKKPASEFLLIDEHSRLGRVLLEQVGAKQASLKHASTSNGRQFRYMARGRAQQRWAEQWLREIEHQQWPVDVVSVRRNSPHLTLVSGFAEHNGDTLSRMFALLRRAHLLQDAE